MNNMLVYTTDKSDPNYINNLVLDESKMSEPIQEMNETISNINKSIERRNTMKKHRGKKKSPQTISFLEKIIRALDNGPMARHKIVELMFGTTKGDPAQEKYTDNILQKIRTSTDNIIASRRGFWSVNTNSVLYQVG